MANTTKMDKVIVNGVEYAFSKVKKDYSDFYFNVYVDGVKNEDMTYYTDDKEDAEETRKAEMARLEAKTEESKKEETEAPAINRQELIADLENKGFKPTTDKRFYSEGSTVMIKVSDDGHINEVWEIYDESAFHYEHGYISDPIEYKLV